MSFKTLSAGLLALGFATLTSCQSEQHTYSRRSALEPNVKFTEPTRNKNHNNLDPDDIPDVKNNNQNTQVDTIPDWEPVSKNPIGDGNPNGIPVQHDLGVVYFGLDSAALNANEQQKVSQLVQLLQQNPSYTVVLTGHCDERGSNEYNLALGERRAQGVMDVLLTLDGSLVDRVKTQSYGEEKPATNGQGESNWSKNRRSEFEVYKPKA